MIIPVLKGIDLPTEVKKVTDFSIDAVAYIGSENDERKDRFYFKMITPLRVTKIVSKGKMQFGRAIFIVNQPSMSANIESVENEIKKLLLDCSRETWEETALAINYYLNWEFYDPNSEMSIL